MIYIFHGDDQFASRSAFSNQLNTYKNVDLLKLDQKETNPELIHQFLQSNSLLQDKKILAITNLFSAAKSNLDKIIKIINSSPSIDVLIWHDKKLTLIQTKNFPQAQIKSFTLDNLIFTCLNSIQPKNLKKFIPLYQKVIDQNYYDLFLYLFKGNIRKNLSSFSRFDPSLLKRTYLNLIELDFQNKTGQLSIPKEIALERIIISLIK